MKLAVFVAILALSLADELPEKHPVKRSYVCPPNFIRLSHKCYYFSKEPSTWQDAFFKCRDLHSNLAVIKNSNQDKHIRRMLGKKTLVPLERWLGGLYDWEQMSWKWAASGKALTYQGFSRMESADKERLRWHCIILDPQLQFKWNSRSCVDQKHFICQTKIKIVSNKGKKKLLRQYNVNKFNKLNEIPVPTIAEDPLVGTNHLKGPLTYEIGNDLNGEFASRPKAQRKRRTRKNRRKKLNGSVLRDSGHVNNNHTMNHKSFEMRDESFMNARNRNNEYKDTSMERIKWKTYYKDATISPLHPKAIVEEYKYVKE